MSDAKSVIRARGLGKKYLIGHQTLPSGTDSWASEILRQVRNVGHRTAELLRGHPIIMGDEVEEVWAVKDVDFDVRSGEALGLIGRNGAGKSTLLKILSRITDPSAGRVEIDGRVASLLEVGTGFHPELSGRDNVFLNGGILGMTRVEIRKEFDSIVEFAGVERYIDTPVKRYSSGMYVRLAFAIAAHLKPEILIVDEVLAVGDTEFQKRCLGKMDEVASSGRTVLFVSHLMPLVASLCSRCILLEAGRVVADGPTSEVIHRYQAGAGANAASIEFPNEANRPGDEKTSLLAAWAESTAGERRFEYEITDAIRIVVKYRVHERLRECPHPNLHVTDSSGNYVFVTNPHDLDPNRAREPGDYVGIVEIPAHFLNDGLYSVGVALNHFENGLQTAFFEKGALNFNIVDRFEISASRAVSRWGGRVPGVVRPLLAWQVEEVSR